ncbi:hypothetical protein [Faecalimicrobium sp. JNUCC 81]
MDNLIFGLIIIVLLTIVLTPIVNLYRALNTTLEEITIRKKIRLKEYKQIHKDLF